MRIPYLSKICQCPGRKEPTLEHSTVDNTTYAASHPEVEGLNPEDYPGFAMPDDDGSAALNDNLDYQDVKLKIVQQEGYDAHDFNLFDDRASQLWRKPYVEGAVQELTSGDNRSADELRMAVEQLMMAAGNKNPDVRLTGSSAPKSAGAVKVDAEIENEEDVLRDVRAIRLGPSPRPNKNIPRARQRFAPWTLSPAYLNISLARPPATPALALDLALSTASQSAHRSPSQRFPTCLHFTRFAVSTRAGIVVPGRSGQAQKYLHDFSHQEARDTLFHNLDWRL